MKRVAITTLGCKTNQFESSAIGRTLEAAGYALVPFPGPADAVVINTCTVTRSADADGRHLIRQAAAAAPGAVLVVTGCYAQVAPGEVAGLPGVDYVVGHADKGRIPEILAAGKPARPAVVRPPFPRVWDDRALAAGPAEGRTRAFLKVQDGCDVFCTFCIVPFARGRSRSLPVKAARGRLQALAAEGYREAVLTGIHLGDYGRDLDPPADLLDLLRALDADAALPRLRISSLFPSQLTPAFIDLFTSARTIVPHLHLSIQSGDDTVLTRMRRRYRRAEIEAAVRAVAARVPGLGLGADLIVGFPGESERAFEETLAMVEALPFTYLHVFPYSPRPGTAAARFPDRVASAIINRRSRRLRNAAARKRAAWHARFVGRPVEVLVERPAEGRSREYLRVRLERPDPQLVNRFVPVEVFADEGGAVLGRLVDPARPGS